MVFQPIAIKGAFTTIIRTYKGIPVVAELRSDIPVAPPSVNSLGSKKPLKPKAAENMPAIINKASVTYCFTLKVLFILNG
jgi:hypothetical protein